MRRRWRWFLAGLALAVMLALGVGLGWPREGDGPARPPVPAAQAEDPAADPPGAAAPPPQEEASPAPPAPTRPSFKRPEHVRGIYATGWVAGSPKRLEELLALIRETELNTLVVDIKDNTGRLTYDSRLPEVVAAKAGSRRVHDLEGLLGRLAEEGVYPIARIVVFEDPVLAPAQPERAVRTKDGGVWRTRKGQAWLDPYNRANWDYVLAIAEEVAGKGFPEIQFDYVRFPSDGNAKNMVFPAADGTSPADTIAAFLAYATERLHGRGVEVSADVFGLTSTAQDDMGIGQVIEKVAAEVDYISPMVYPSHYGPGNYGLADPDAHPYETVYKSLSDAVYRTEGLRAQVRPWLQDFSLGHKYGPREVRAQIQAAYDAGLTDWLLWNPASRFTPGALEKEGDRPATAGEGAEPEA